MEVTDDLGAPAGQPPDDRFAEVRNGLLREAGGAYSLDEVAVMLGASREAVHRAVQMGDVLGVVIGSAVVVPRIQMKEIGGKALILPGIGQVAKTFMAEGGSHLGALQFLLRHDPNLVERPIDVLKAGQVDDVVRAARAHLRADEE
jgi:hypothetical protein